MPANLTPQYLEAEAKFKLAKSVPEKVKALEVMMAIIPKHKGTEHLRGQLKSRMAKLKDELQKRPVVGKAEFLCNVKREGAGQVVLLGFPNSAKSSLLSQITHASSEVADYPFTTQRPIPGMMDNHYFGKNGAVIIGSDGCWEALRLDGDAKFAEMAGREPGLKSRYPDLKMGQLQLTFAQSLTIRLPGVEVQVLHSAHNGKSHSLGDSIAYIERDRILYAGDLLYTRYHPVTVYGDIPNWICSIDQLMTQSFTSVVPGHGPVSEGGEAYQAAFAEFRAYLSDFHQRLLELKDGKKSPGDVETHMKSGVYAQMGKTYMVKRNIEYFLKQ